MDQEVEDEDAKYCSACLAVNVKMILLQKSNLFEVFESITRNSEKKPQSIPQYLCYTCSALLRKCAQFHSMCRQAQHLMTELKSNCVMTNSRHLLKQALNLTVTKTEQVNYIPEDVDTKIATKIKVEDPVGFQQEAHNYDIDTKFETAEREASPFDVKISVEVQTLEHDDIQVIDGPAICDSDLDQPLAVLKTGLLRKALTVPSKKKVVKKTVKKSTKSIKNKEKQEQLKPVVKKQKAKCNKYNEKFEKDFEEFCKNHNMDLVFLTKEQQIERMKVRYKDSKYCLHCEHCFAGFVTDTAYENHVKKHDPSSGTFVCEVCQLRYKDKVNLQQHKRFHKKQFICKLCCKSLANSYLAMQHHRWHEGFIYECKYCKKKFNVVSTHLNHVRQKHTPVRCQDCGESFEGTIRLKRHRDSTHCEPPSDHASDASNRTTAPKMSPCNQCGSRFDNRTKLQTHIKRVHLKMKYDMNIVCEFCGKKCTSITLFKNHQRTHTGEKPYQCGFCSRRFTVKNQLAVHIRTHTGEKPFRCEVCDRRFAQQAALNRHYRVHTGAKPYSCTYCSKTFTQSNSAKLHISTVHLKIPQKRRNRRHKQHTADFTEQK